jgi:tetratricopeptide (TPR) repeat protein
MSVKAKKKRFLRAAAPFALAALCASAVQAQNILTTGQWKEDLDFLVKTVAEKHRHAFDVVTRTDFEKAAAELKERLPGMSDHEAIVGLVKLVALLRDGHSRLTLPVGAGADAQSHTATDDPRGGLAFHALPVQFYLFSDGLRIQATTPELKTFLGAKVIQIGSLDSDKALEAVRPTVSYDSEMWVRLTAPQHLRLPEILHACGVTAGIGEVPLVLEKDGRAEAVVLKPLPTGPEPEWTTWYSVSKTVKPLYLKNRAKPFWFELLEPSRILYVQVNSIQNDKDETLGAFAARLKEFIALRRPEKLVLDLRWNGGGNNYLNRGLVLALIDSDSINRYGRLFTIIGRNTFSAAVSLTTALEQWTETIFVGEPTGNTPSQYGDSRKYVLPHSGLTVRLSSVYWRDWSSNERRPWVAADLKADLSWADYQAGKDPALEAILAYAVPATLLGQLKEKYAWGGKDAAANHYYRYKNSPVTGRTGTASTLVDFAAWFAGLGNDSEAVGILKQCLSEYPESFPALLNLGQASVRLKDAAGAVEALKKALALRPADPEAVAWLKKAEELGPARK